MSLNLPLYILLIPYFIFFVIFLGLFFIILSRLLQTKALNLYSYLVVVLVSISCLFILLLTWSLLRGMDWAAPWQIFSQPNFSLENLNF